MSRALRINADWFAPAAKMVTLHAMKSNVALESINDDVKYISLKEAFKITAGSTEITMQTCKRVIAFSRSLAARDEHVTFFGGHYLGVERIRFFDTDRDQWFDEVLQIDEAYLQENIHSVKAINKDWKVAGDPFNLSVVWFVHQCMAKLNPRDKLVHEAMVEALVVLQFRFYTSIYSYYFEKPVDTQAAAAVYSALSMKFAIKALESWGALLRDRAENFIAKDSIHYRDFLKFDKDEAVLYIVTDMSTRTRKTIKDQYKVLEMIRSGNTRIENYSSSINLNGEKIIRDHVNAYNTAKYYLLDVSGNESSFIKLELVNVVLDLMTTTSRQSLLDVLQAMSRAQGTKRDYVEDFMQDTLMHAFDYIVRNRVAFNDAMFILEKMKALYMSSKTSDKLLLSLRSRIERYAKQNSSLRSPSALASVRTAVMLYCLLRALSANIYS